MRRRNLLGRLRERSPAELRRIAACWDVALTGREHAEQVGQLYRAMRDPWAARDRLEGFGTAERALLEALLTDADVTRTADELAAATGLPAMETGAAIASLVACGVLFEEAGADDAPAYFLARELATIFGRLQEERLLGDALRPDAPLRALLSTLEEGELEEAGRHWGLRITPGVLARAALTDEILARVDLPEQRRATVGDLPAPAARLFQALREADGPLTLPALRDRLGLDAPALRDAGRALAERLLVWHAYVDGERVLFIPRDVLAPKRPARDAPPPLTPVEAAPDERPTHPFAAAWDLLTILRRLTQGLLEWREGDEERNATALRRLAPLLWRGAGGAARPGYVPFLIELARDEGLARFDEDDRLAATGAVEEWRNRTFLEQTRILYNRWQGARDWPEGLSQDDLQLLGVDWPAMRRAVLEELRSCRVGAWYDAGALALRIARLRPTLLGGSFSAARSAGSAGTRDEVSAAAVAIALHGGLVPLGALREGEASKDRPALQLTDLGGWLLGLRPEFAPPAPGDRALAVGADFEVLLFRPTPRRLWALGAVAEPVRLDTVSVHRLTAAAVQRGIAGGLALDQIVAFLERGGGAPLPQHIAYTLREWAREHAGVRLARALALRPDDGVAVERVLTALARAGLPPAEALPDGRLLLPLSGDGDPAPALEALRAAGLTPHWAREPRPGGTPPRRAND